MSAAPIRITVALDPAAPRQEVFEAVHALCGAAPTEITALFVEDDNLDRLAALPGARQVVLGALPRAQALDAQTMHRQLAQRAERVRLTCDATITRLRLTPMRFLVRRGRVVDELARESAHSDLLVVGRSLRSASTRSWLGVDPMHLIHQTRGPEAVLFVHEPWRTGTTVVVVTTGQESDTRVIAHATTVAEREGLPLKRIEARASEGASLAARSDHLDARVLVVSDALLADPSVRAVLPGRVLASVLVIR